MIKLHPLVIAFLFVCALPNPTALAQEPPSAEEMEKAAKRFGEAEAFFQLHDYTKALEGYKEAYLLSKAPEMLFNIGQCQRRLGHYEDAIKSYKSFLAALPQSPQRPSLEALIVELDTLAKRGVTEESLKKAATRFEEAEAFFQVQDYTKALEGYKESYLLSKAPELLFNIGQCQRKLGHYEDAIESYKSFLAGAPNASNRTDVEALIVELEAKEKPQSKGSHKLLYAGAGAFGGFGLVLGGLSISAGRKAGELGEINDGEIADLAEIQRLLTNSRRLGFAADSLVVMALISGGAGFILGRSDKENKEPSAVLSLSPTGAILSVRF